MSKGSNSQTTNSSSSTAPNPDAMAAYQALLARATNVSQTPYAGYTGQEVAPINTQQYYGVGNINAGAGGFGAYAGQAGADIAGGAQAVNGADIAQYMDPYQQQVINATQADFNTQNALANSAVTGNAAAQGALGGNRVGVAQALTQEAQGRTQAPVIAGLESQGFQNAVANANAQKQREISGGQALSGANLQNAQAQFGVGSAMQQTQQAQNTQAMTDYYTQQGYPFATAQWLASMVLPTGSQMGSTSTGTQQVQGPTPNTFSQLAGLGIAGLTAYSDKRLKENIHEIGKLHDGQKIYRYNFKGDPQTQVGLISQEVEKHHPEAVHKVGGFGKVDYDAATADAVKRWSGGAIHGFAPGGSPYDETGAPYSMAKGWVPTVGAPKGNPMAPAQLPANPSKMLQQPGSDKDYTKMGQQLGGLGKQFNTWLNKPGDADSTLEEGFGLSAGDENPSGYADGGTPYGTSSAPQQPAQPLNAPVANGFGTSNTPGLGQPLTGGSQSFQSDVSQNYGTAGGNMLPPKAPNSQTDQLSALGGAGGNMSPELGGALGNMTPPKASGVGNIDLPVGGAGGNMPQPYTPPSGFGLAGSPPNEGMQLPSSGVGVTAPPQAGQPYTMPGNIGSSGVGVTAPPQAGQPYTMPGNIGLANSQPQIQSEPNYNPFATGSNQPNGMMPVMARGGAVRRNYADAGVVPVSSGFGGGAYEDVDATDLPPIRYTPSTKEDKIADINAVRLAANEPNPDDSSKLVASNLGILPRPIEPTIVDNGVKGAEDIGILPPGATPTAYRARPLASLAPRGGPANVPGAAADKVAGMGGWKPLGLSDEARQGLISMGLGMMATKRGGPGSFLGAVGEGGEQGMATYASAKAATAAQAVQARKEAFEREKFETPYTRQTKEQELKFKELQQQHDLERQKFEEQQRQNDRLEYHVVKNEDGTETPVFVDRKNQKITNPNGTPYIPKEPGTSDASEIAKSIIKGDQPPKVSGFMKGAKAVRAALAREGFDLTTATLEYEAAHKQIQSLNGPQMVRYAGLAQSVIRTIDEVNDLATQMQNTGVPLFNKARIQAYIQTAGNSENGKLAARYLAATNTLKEEFANLAQGGYAPTEAAWHLANQQINENYGVHQLGASLSEVQRLIKYRMQGIPNFEKLGPNAGNRYTRNPGTEKKIDASEAPQKQPVAKPTLQEFLTKAKSVNPNATDKDLTDYYNKNYGD